MYNRYIPQPDGSHRRTQCPDAPRSVPHPQQVQRERQAEEPTPPCPVPAPEAACGEEPKKTVQLPTRPIRKQRYTAPSARKNPSGKCQSPAPNTGSGNGSAFLRQLLPKDLDTGDLLVIVLLLLMAGDCPEDKENALLTLALYLFL